jgi:Tfp pilus assembly protein PilO
MKPIIPTILIIASVAAFFGFVDPRYESVKLLQAEKSQYDEALDNARELRKLRDSLNAVYKTIPLKDLDRLQKFLPDHIDNVRLIIDINDIAKRYGLALKSVKNIDANKTNRENEELGPDQSKYGSTVINFSVLAPYSNFIAFLKDLEQSLRLVDVVSLDFDAKEGSLYDFNLGIKTYWLK